MDIVKRTYLSVKDNTLPTPELDAFHVKVINEVIRLIKARAYERRVWPPEFGPLPDELKGRMSKEVTT